MARVRGKAGKSRKKHGQSGNKKRWANGKLENGGGGGGASNLLG